MRLDELIRVSLFVAVVVIVYALAIRICVMDVLRRYRGGDKPRSVKAAWLRRAVILFAALGIVCMAYGRFVEPRWPEVTHVEIKSHKIPAGIPPIRIVLISDIHSQDKPLLETRLPEIISAQKPDLIFYTGDSANTEKGIAVFRGLMQRLTAIAPVYAVEGNWDIRRWQRTQLFGGTAVHELDGKAEKADVRGTELWLAGVPYEYLDEFTTMMDSIPPSAFTILLYHSPDLIESLEPGKVDLYCAGHTHGGQVALPFYGALITFSQFGKKYESGLYHVGETWLYVNRGIGMEGGPTPNVRFWARPEITVIDIVGAK